MKKTLKTIVPRAILWNQLSPIEKQYQEQIKIDSQYIERPLKILFIIFIILETIRAAVTEVLFAGPIRWREIIPRIIYSVLISIPIFGNVLPKNENLKSLQVMLRKLGIIVGTASYTALIVAINIWRAEDFVKKFRDERDRFDFLSFGFFMVINVIISDLIFRRWIYKCIVPMFDLASLGYSIIVHQAKNPIAVLSYIATLIFYLTAFFWVKEMLRWKIFLHRRSMSEWTHIHEEILKIIPDNVAVYDFNGAILFENEYFKKFRNNIKDKDILESIIRVKKRKRFGSSQSLIEDEYSNSSETNSQTNILENAQSIGQNIDYGSLATKVFNNLADIIEIVKRLYKEDKIDNKDLLVFDGKCLNKYTKETLSIEIKLVVFEDPEGDSKKLLVILRDTTQRDLISILESNNKFKDNMIDSISHELRTPLNGFKNLLDLCKQEQDLPRKIKENYIIPASTSATILSHIVDDILDYSLLLKNKLSMKFEKVDVLDLLQNCYKLIKNQYGQQNLTFELEVDKIPKYIHTDPERLARVIVNLLSNAFKFTRRGSITLKAKQECEYLRIIVSDTGVGMDRETTAKLANIFVESLNGEKVSSYSTGVGLGITLSQCLSYFLGPKGMCGLCFASKLCMGSIFSFLVEDKHFVQPDCINMTCYRVPPLKRLSSKKWLKGELELAPDNSIMEHLRNDFKLENKVFSMFSENFDSRSLSENIKFVCPKETSQYLPSKSSRWKLNRIQRRHSEILVVDDEPINILALEMLFKQLGKSIDKAYGGEEAIQLIKRRRSEMRLPCPKVYKMVFVDLNMPVLDGFETTKIIKEMTITNQIEDMVIVACTAYPECEYKPKCLEAGMSEFINKPVTLNKIVEILKKYDCL